MSDKWTCLIRIKSADGLRSHLIDRPSFTIGRTQDADIPLLASSVSRVHLIIEVKDGEVWVTDKNSANGTFRNNAQMAPGVQMMIDPTDVLRLGTEPDEFQLLAFPVPVELQGKDLRADSLKDSMKDLAKQFEAQSKERVEKELRRARSESEQIIAEAKKLAEIQRTQDSVEIQTRRQAIDDELGRLRQTTMEELSRERQKAKREADTMIAEAQRTIQKDFDEAGKKIELQMSEAHARSLSILQQAELNGQTDLNEAREEAMRVRNAASEEARTIHKDAVKKAEEYLVEIQAKYTRELAEQKTQMLEAARVEARNESERTISGLAQAREDLEFTRERLEKLRTQTNEAKSSLEDVESKKKAIQAEGEQLRRENEKLIEEIKKVTDLESRRDKAQSQLDTLVQSQKEKEASVEREVREMREKRLLEVQSMKLEQDNDMAKARVKALDDIKRLIREEEKKYEETKRLRALDLAQLLNARLIPQVSTWLADGEAAPGLVKTAVEHASIDCLVNSGTALQNVTVLEGKPKETVEQRDKKNLKKIAMVVAAVIVAAYFFRHEIEQFAQNSQKNSYSSKMMDERKAASVYKPEQTPEYRSTYVDNVLYMTRYYDVKSDGATIEAWTLKLNDLNILRPMKLTEEDIIKFVSKETNLVLRLGVQRSSIDAVYLNEGIDRLRKAEDEDVKEMTEILKGEENYKKIREIEKTFLLEYMKKH